MPRRTPATTEESIPYQPATWNADQRAMHCADSLEDAFNRASCLAGGWYRRPVKICVTTHLPAGERYAEESYALLPSDTPTPEGYSDVYEVKRLCL